MFLASCDFAAVHASTSGASLACLLFAALAFGPALMMGFVSLLSQRRGMTRTSSDVGVFRVARDGRSFIQVGRACHFGRKGETEASLRARMGV